MIKTWATITVLFLVQWFFLFSLNPPSWDGAFYYAYARSAVMDGDLHLANDLQLGYPAAPQFGAKKLDEQRTDTNHVVNLFAPGTAVQWLPLMAVGRVLGLNGHEPLFLRTAAIISALTGLAAFALSAQIVRKLNGDKAMTATISTITMMVATPLLYYQFRDPWYSHTMSAFTITAVIWLWLRTRTEADTADTNENRWMHLALGLLIGLATLVRWQNIIYVILPLATMMTTRTWDGIKRLFITGVGTAAVVALQLALWKLYFDAWLTIPQGEQFVDWSAQWLLPLLFSPFMGIVAWFPAFVPAFIGLFIALKRHTAVILPLLIILLLELYVNGSTRDWYGGGGFGPRRYTSELCILIIGYNTFLHTFKRLRWPLLIGLAWHQLMLLQYGLRLGLGGRILSKAPLWEWEGDSWGDYAIESGRLMLNALNPQSDFWLYPNSPFGQMRNGIVPTEHLIGLLAGVALWGLVAVSAQMMRLRRSKARLASTGNVARW